ncbi:MAG: hypothetical protein H7039_06030, partial [Bryobacteraceae bacterium]|nr:hypothetical protein [Bryobacteraceae bacterium]
LSFRRQFPARILHPSRLGNKWSNGLRAIAVIGNETDRNVLQPALDAGATVLASATNQKLTQGLTTTGIHDNGYKLFAAGKGSIAISPTEWNDPYGVIQDAQRILSRGNDVVRLWNSGSSIAHPTQNNSGASVQVLNYSGRPAGHPMSVWLARRFPEAQVSDLFGRTETLTTDRRNEGTEVNVPVFTTYAAIDFKERA